MDDKRYFSHAWAMLTRDRGWIKPIFVMAAANLVPVAGALGNRGYAMEWARLTAWGIDAAPKQKNVDIGRCIASGWRALLVALGWSIVFGSVLSLANSFAAVFPGNIGKLFAVLVSVVGAVVGTFWGSIVLVTQIRAAIYEKVSAGYRPDRVFEMIGRDMEGFVKVFLANLCCTAIVTAISVVLGIIVAAEVVPSLVAVSSYTDTAAIVGILSMSLGWVALTVAAFGSLLAVVHAMTSLVTSTVAALWMRQFQVPRWGRSEDPLP